MKYLIMLYGSQQDYDVLAGRPTGKPLMSAADVAALHAQMQSVHEALVISGELVDAQGLTAPAHARRVRLQHGLPVVTDGPYSETAEVLAGYTVVECDSPARAAEIAASLINPAVEGEYVDVRPLLGSVAELEV
jgi:hypothetical protein